MNKLVKSAGVAALCVPVLFSTVSPADAATRWTYRSSGVSADVQFLVMGKAAGIPGNAHVGHLSASDDGVWGYITDWRCPSGEYPPYGEEGEEGDGGEETNCTYQGSRELSGEDGQADVAVSRKLTSASVTGTLTEWTWSEGDEEGSSTTSTVDVSFAGEGGTWSDTSYARDRNYRYKYESTYRAATVSGTVAGLSLDDAVYADAQLRKYKEFERYSSR